MSDLKPLPQLDFAATLLIGLIALVAFALLLIALVVLLSRPRRHPARPQRRGAHRPQSDRGTWLERIDAVVHAYHGGEVSREDAFRRLARIARDLASDATGRDLSFDTLSDLARIERSSSDARALDALRTTIEALYPPEFADATVNGRARDVSVEEAAGWVADLVERCRR